MDRILHVLMYDGSYSTGLLSDRSDLPWFCRGFAIKYEYRT